MDDAAPSEANLVLELAYPAGWWRLTADIRKLVASYCAHRLPDPTFTERVSMVCHELLENGVKYAATPDHQVALALELTSGQLVVTVANTSSAEHVARLQREMALVFDGDALEVYLRKMQENLDSDVSQLGLARIRYEGEAELDANVQDLDVQVQARFQLPGG